ncbi:CapA family protein [Micromonospora sp. NPDC126480]|uniref:CapA family protein n=1 Tax=Micromonospora sp. NPDC126480 TaxID=3155312 RepID=UPI0033269E7E
MYAASPLRPRPRRLLPAVGVLLAALLAAGCGGAAPGAGGVWQPGVGGGATGAPLPSAEASEAAAISLSATGDIIMGNAPNRLPANNGKGFFDDVEKALAADLVMGNLEEPLTVDTGTGKCGANSTRCFQFRAPPEYAAHLRDAGFDLLNQANNHGHDYGAKGYRNTQAALEKYELAHTGAPDQITVVDVKGVKVAVAGFSSYPWSNPLTDIPAAKEVVAKAAEQADLVVVQVHMGAEGADRTRVKPGTELYLGENRGDPVRFSKAMIDAGADLIVGHGPHVLRGMEFYKGRLIAYSLGNFAGGGKMLNNSGRLGWGGVLKVSLKPDGTWAGGSFTSTYMNGAGLPTMDADDRGLELVRELSGRDFPKTGAVLDDAGKISPPDEG